MSEMGAVCWRKSFCLRWVQYTVGSHVSTINILREKCSIWESFSYFQIADLQQEHQREMEGLLENVRQLSRELKLQMTIIDNFIPPEYQVLVNSLHNNMFIQHLLLTCKSFLHTEILNLVNDMNVQNKIL